MPVEFQPKQIHSFTLTQAGVGATETLVNPSALNAALSAGPCRLVGISIQANGSALGAGSIALRDALAVGGGSTAVYVTNTALPAAAGQGQAWYEKAYGMLFRNGITAQISNSNAAVTVTATFVFEQD